MTKRTALEITEKATDMLLQQHAEIKRLTALNSALTAKANVFVIANTRLAEKIDSLTAERDTAIAAVLAERNDITDQLREWADKLGFTNSWRWKTPRDLLHRAAAMVSDRTKP